MGDVVISEIARVAMTSNGLTGFEVRPIEGATFRRELSAYRVKFFGSLSSPGRAGTLTRVQGLNVEKGVMPADSRYLRLSRTG